MAIKTRPKAEPLPPLSYAAVATTEQMAEYYKRQIKKRERDQAKANEPKKPGRPPSGKVRVTMLLDPAVIAKFKATGDGWQARINDVLMAAKV